MQAAKLSGTGRLELQHHRSVSVLGSNKIANSHGILALPGMHTRQHNNLPVRKGMLTRLIKDSVKLVTRSCWLRMICMSAAAMCSLASAALEASLSVWSSSEMLSPPLCATLVLHGGTGPFKLSCKRSAHLNEACYRAEMLQKDGTWLLSWLCLGNVNTEKCCGRGKTRVCR